MLEGLNYMHKLGIIHRDIKLANVVKNSQDADDLSIKLVDLGFAIFKKINNDENDFCGSPTYMSPEICLHRPYNEKVDIWALGIVLFKLLNGDNNNYPPYEDVFSFKELTKKM